MLKGISLVELAQKIEGNRGLKRDFVTDASTLRAEYSEPVANERGTVSLVVPEHGAFPIRPIAHDQIGGRLGIPGRYYDKMLADAPGLLVDNVNTWLARSTEKRMVRTLGGDARAFLSNRYQRIENEEIAEVALPVLAKIPDVRIVSAEVTERRLYIQAVSPRVEGEVKRGDVVQAGAVISNSEVGHGAVTVSPMVYRLVCLNGAICADRFRAYHVGKNIDDNAALWAEDTQKADDKAVLLKVRDMVTAAVDAVRFSERVERMRALTEGKIVGDPAKAVEVLAQKIGANETEGAGMLRALIEGSDLSAWGLLNAVTAQAHSATSYDRGVELEAAGGALIDLPATEWRKVLEAA